MAYYDLTQTGAQVQTILNNALDADHVVYDNTNSGLAATDVQAAIDEVVSSTPAANISYDNTNSGLSATNVQTAIDEVASADGIAYDNTNTGMAATDVQAAIDELGSIRIVATGTDNSWSYRKWSDGTYEAWIRNDDYGTANTSASQNGWYRAVISLTLPSFVDSDNFDCYVVQASCRNKYSFSAAFPEDNTIKVMLLAASSGSDSYRVTGYLRGTYS